jgi:hypothetical protein
MRLDLLLKIHKRELEILELDAKLSKVAMGAPTRIKLASKLAKRHKSVREMKMALIEEESVERSRRLVNGIKVTSRDFEEGDFSTDYKRRWSAW